jgi:hypothetical protein
MPERVFLGSSPTFHMVLIVEVGHTPDAAHAEYVPKFCAGKKTAGGFPARRIRSSAGHSAEMDTSAFRWNEGLTWLSS